MILKKSFTKICSLAACAGLAISLAACGGNSDTSKKDGEYLTVGGTPISYDEFRYYFLSTKDYLQSQNESLELPELLTTVEENLKKDYGIRNWAESQNVSLTDEEKKTIQENNEMMITMMGGEEEFQQALDAMYCTKDLYNKMIEMQTLHQKALNEWFNKNYADKVVDFFTDNKDYVHVQHILIQFEDTTEGADHSAEKAKADEVYQKAINGENFEDLIKEYNQDPGQNADMRGYTFTYGMMVKEFEDASFALEENAISEPVETSYGYHIIKRLPIDFDYVRENASSLAPLEIIEEANANLDTEIQACIDAVEVKKGSLYDSLTLESFADTIPTPSPAPSSEDSSVADSSSTAQENDGSSSQNASNQQSSSSSEDSSVADSSTAQESDSSSSQSASNENSSAAIGSPASTISESSSSAA